MRALLCLLLALGLSACDVLGPRGVSVAAVTSVRVEALDLDKPWDNPFTDDKPDIYVDLFDSGAGLNFSPEFRSEVRENVRAYDLPLLFPVPGSYEVELVETATLNVSDRDGPGTDDQMFTTGPVSFADLYEGQERGEYASIAFENEQGRVIVTVQWR